MRKSYKGKERDSKWSFAGELLDRRHLDIARQVGCVLFEVYVVCPINLYQVAFQSREQQSMHQDVMVRSCFEPDTELCLVTTWFGMTTLKPELRGNLNFLKRQQSFLETDSNSPCFART